MPFDALKTFKEKRRLVQLAFQQRSQTIDLEQHELGMSFGYNGYTVQLRDYEYDFDYAPYYMADYEIIWDCIKYGLNGEYAKAIKYPVYNVDDLPEDIYFVSDRVIREYMECILPEIIDMNRAYWNVSENDVHGIRQVCGRIHAYDIGKPWYDFTRQSDFYFAKDFYEFKNGEVNDDFRINTLEFKDEYFKQFIADKEMPFLYLIYVLLDAADRNYLLNDMNTMSEKKLRYFVGTLMSLCFDEVSPTDFAIDHVRKDSYARPMAKNFKKIVELVIKSAPNHVENFPFKSIKNKIPSLSVYPKTSMAWLLTNVYCDMELAIDYEFCRGQIPNTNDPENIKENTKLLLPYIQCPEKAFELYNEYENIQLQQVDGDLFLDADDYLDHIDSLDSGGKPGFLEEFEKVRNEENGISISMKFDPPRPLKNMIVFVQDGRGIYETFPNEIELEDGTKIKMARITQHMSMLKQVRNSIYNHREEKKISLDYMMKHMSAGDMMHIDVRLSDELEELRMIYKKELLFYGKKFKHCLGTFTDSKDLFFRKDTVCARVRIKSYGDRVNSFEIAQCLDKENNTTDESRLFNDELVSMFEALIESYNEEPVVQNN